jgi:hypothetical protein
MTAAMTIIRITAPRTPFTKLPQIREANSE